MKTTFTAKLLRGTTLAGLALALAAPASAQLNDNDEIIVTATKRASTIQDVPFSIAAVTGENIERLGATNLEDVSRAVAALSIQNLGPGQSQVAIRGVSAGQIVRDQPGVKEQVGVYLDESVISLSLFTPDLDLYDLNRVEVLRGPQGTLFGSGSMGGTIRYITNQPNLDEAEATAEINVNAVSGGELGGHIKGMTNAPFANGKAAFRAVAYATKYGGFIDARREDGSVTENINDGERWGGRVAVRLEPAEGFAITPRVTFQKINVDGFNRQEQFNLFANPFTTTRPAVTLGEREQFLLLDEKFTDEILIADLTIEKSFDYFDVTSVSSYTDRDILVSRDASALTGSVSVDLGYPDAAVTLPSNLLDTTGLKQFTQELRASSNNDGAFQWLIGGFYSDTQREYAQRLPTPGYDAFTDATLGAGTSTAVANGFAADSPFNSDLPYDLEQIAVFGEGSYTFDRLTLTAGARYYDFNETRTITSGGLFANGDSGVVDETSADGINPRFLASYELSDSVTLNAQAARGFRLGGVNDPLNANLCNAADRAIFGGSQDFDDETTWNYEGGVKVQKNGMTLNAAAFYADISGLQATLDAGSCSSRIVFNVPDAHSKGIELEFLMPIGDDWEYSFNGSLIEAEFDSTVVDGAGNVIGGLREGNDLPSVPNFQMSAALTHYFDMPMAGAEGGYFTVSAQHVGERFTQPSDQEPGASVFVSGLPFGGATGADATLVDLNLDSYTLFNLSSGFDYENWGFQVYVTNLTDENANLSFDRERGGRARLGFRTNNPRTFGMTARYRY